MEKSYVQKKAIVAIFVFLAVSFLVAQEIDKTQYVRITLRESIARTPAINSVEYHKVEVKFVRSFSAWGGIHWEVATPDGGLTGIYILAPDLPQPEDGQIVIIFLRVFGSPLGVDEVIDHWVATN